MVASAMEFDFLRNIRLYKTFPYILQQQQENKIYIKKSKPASSSEIK